MTTVGGDGLGVADAARNLSRSLAQLLQTAVDEGLFRLEQLGSAVAAERRHLVRQVLLAIGLVLLLLLGAIFTGLAIIAAFWDTHRIAAMAAVAGGYLLLAVIAGLLLWRGAHRKAEPADWASLVVGLLAGARMRR